MANGVQTNTGIADAVCFELISLVLQETDIAGGGAHGYIQVHQYLFSELVCTPRAIPGRHALVSPFKNTSGLSRKPGNGHIPGTTVKVHL